MSALRSVLVGLFIALAGIGSIFHAQSRYDPPGSVDMLLSVDTAPLRTSWLDALAREVRQRLGEANISTVYVTVMDGAVRVQAASPEDAERALGELQSMGGAGNEVKAGGERFVTIKPAESVLVERVDQILTSAIDTLRRRLHAAGVTVRQIFRVGPDSIRVRTADIAGPNNVERFRDIVAFSERLSVHEVHPEPPRALGAPGGFKVYPVAGRPDEPGLWLRETPIASDHEVADASASFDRGNQQMEVTIALTPAASHRLRLFTERNIGRPFAVVLDGHVVSVPVIHAPIINGSIRIRGDLAISRAQQIALALRSPAPLPAHWVVVEERVTTGGF